MRLLLSLWLWAKERRCAVVAWWRTRRAFCIAGRGCWLTPAERPRLTEEVPAWLRETAERRTP